MTSTSPGLQTELAAYQKLLPALAGDEGRFALVAGESLLGIFDTYPDALAAGYGARGLEPFLVKRISQIDVISYFTRDIRPVCLTSPVR